MDNLKSMKEQMISIVQGQLAHTDCVDTKELGEAVDMIKDLAEACYYCTITEAMEESKDSKNENNTYYYTMPSSMPYDGYERGRMYYGGDRGNQSGNMRGYYPMEMYRDREWSDDPQMMLPHDPKEGRAMRSRRNYMESKEMHKDPATRMRDLEKYIKDLGEDITEMIANATPEEKQILQQKIATLATKVNV